MIALESIRPFCYKCQKLVESFEAFNNFQNNTNRFIAKCHGEEEITELPKETLEVTMKIEAGMAIPKKMIEEIKVIE